MGDRLTGKIAVITGASEGIGFAIAEKFVEEGGFVFITGRREVELQAAVEKIGRNVIGIQADSAKLADLDAVYQRVADEKGRLDIVVANAGTGKFFPLGTITEEQYESEFDVNVKGVLFTVQKALPLLADGSSIIVVSSTASNVGTYGLSVYSASKAAARNFVRSWILDLKARKIRVNVLSPGVIATPGIIRNAGTPEQCKELLAKLGERVPLGRVGESEELAEGALFLASDASSYVNGIDLIIDGGKAQIGVVGESFTGGS